MAEFNPTEQSAAEVQKHLEKSDADEVQRVLAAELAGKKRKTVLEAWGVDPNERRDATGRVLNPWEVSPADQIVQVVIDESDEDRRLREAQNEADAATATAQGGTTPGAVTTGGGDAALGGGLAPSGNTAGDTPGNTHGI